VHGKNQKKGPGPHTHTHTHTHQPAINNAYFSEIRKEKWHGSISISSPSKQFPSGPVLGFRHRYHHTIFLIRGPRKRWAWQSGYRTEKPATHFTHRLSGCWKIFLRSLFANTLWQD